ncbi:LuxR C-terminal-related transcriptional regulator [Cohnella sp. GCM10027633]|uniref:LuxR C-terminal-related transcriptional regulator n=1 Tax=unclassified Cohnella TaxID=2636738 RepID=UPI00363901B4
MRRPRLVERMNAGAKGKLTLVSAHAGFGKTTLVAEWAAYCERPVAWLSLDGGDNDPARFLNYVVAALRTVDLNIGEGVFSLLRSPLPPPIESIATTLINEIASMPSPFVLVLDDYHAIEAEPIDRTISLLVDRMPPRMHLVIATREDPRLPLAQLRARAQLAEVRTADLRFTASEAALFLNDAMALDLQEADVERLAGRTEGWIAGLQLAAISLQGQEDAAVFMDAFAGDHPYVLDYLIEEVVQRQPDRIQTFLLRTSILDRMCGDLCEAVWVDEIASSGQSALAELERRNLFIVPLDNERRWYRYHHLFAESLRQRLNRSVASAEHGKGASVAELHVRASAWFEDNGFELEAFRHATAAGDVERAARLMDGGGMPLLFRGAVGPILGWLESLPASVLNGKPALWVTYASAMMFAGRMNDAERKLQAAEAALRGIAPDDDRTRDLIGHIASIRATLAVSRHDADTIVEQSRRALDHLHPNNLPVRTATTWTLGYAYQLQGDRTAAGQAYAEAIEISRAIGHYIIEVMATIGLGTVQEDENELELATDTYRRALRLAGDPALPVACEAYLGLARISYERNDLDEAELRAEQAYRLALLIDNTDRYVSCEAFLTRLKLARGDPAGAATLLSRAGQSTRRHGFVLQIPEVVSARSAVLLRQGNAAEAARIAEEHRLHGSLARAQLASGDFAAALKSAERSRQQAEANGFAKERLRAIIAQALALHALGNKAQAVRLLGEALAVAEAGGFVRTFVDEGPRMARLLADAGSAGISPNAIRKLKEAFDAEDRRNGAGEARNSGRSRTASLLEPLSEREMEVLRLIAQGLSNEEIGKRLYLALSSVKGHNQNIFGKLQVGRRTEAVARARELGLLRE